MKKLLIFILIAIVVCSSVDTDVEAVDWKGIWNKVKGFFTEALNFLKKYELYDPIVNALKKNLPSYAESLCTSKGVPNGICRDIINFLLSYL